MTWSKKYPNLTLNIVLIFIAVVLVESFLRVSGIGYGISPIEADQRLHHRHPRNYEYLAYHPGGEFIEHTIFYDEFGYRVKSKNPIPVEDEKDRRIAFLGDGFTEANAVSWEQSFVGLIESNNSNLEVRNFGVSSYSPVIYLAQMKNEVKSFKPTDVVVQIYQNDFYNDREYLKMANTVTLSEINAISKEASIGDTLKKILRYSYFARLVRKFQQQMIFLLLDKSDSNDRFFEIAIADQSNESKKSQTYAAMLMLKDFSDKMNFRIFFFIIPNKQLALRNECCESDSLALEFDNFTESNNLNLIDVPKAFGDYSDQSNLFFENDNHFSVQGHLLTAELISKKLRLDENR